jgi:prepilin-type N-terminal cleavage/methylation domain-containing protein
MPSRPAFTLTELLVVVAIILGLMTLLGSAVSAARSGAKVSSTRATIEKLNTILATQLATYDSRPVDQSGRPAGTSASAYRAWFIRRNMITGDMPDRWTDVQYMATPANGWVPQSAAQRAYISIWNSLASAQQTAVMANNASAECLFMVVMRGGIAGCLDCGSLRTSQIGDQDGDGMPEFWDDWGNPIGYLLWAPALELPPGSGTRFFSGSRALDTPWTGTNRPTLGMRPVIYSAGPDGINGYDRQDEGATLSAGTTPVIGANCGSSLTTAGGQAGSTDNRGDNITNLDAEAKQ